jgi:hypothetical protein
MHDNLNQIIPAIICFSYSFLRKTLSKALLTWYVKVAKNLLSFFHGISLWFLWPALSFIFVFFFGYSGLIGHALSI